MTGSIVSSTVLRQNVSEIDEEILEFCGVNDCPGNNASNPYAEKPPQSTVSHGYFALYCYVRALELHSHNFHSMHSY